MSEIINLKNKIDDILKKKIKEFQLKNIAIDIVKNNKDMDETILLENYHGQILNNHNENTNFEIIEEINLIAGGR